MLPLRFSGPIVAQTSLSRRAWRLQPVRIVASNRPHLQPLHVLRREASFSSSPPVTPEAAGSSPVAPVHRFAAGSVEPNAPSSPMIPDGQNRPPAWKRPSACRRGAFAPGSGAQSQAQSQFTNACGGENQGAETAQDRFLGHFPRRCVDLRGAPASTQGSGLSRALETLGFVRRSSDGVRPSGRV
jgi:hypothetical protein